MDEVEHTRGRGPAGEDDLSTVQEVVVRFSGLELARLRELAAPEGATVEEYVRACVLGPRAPGPVELLAEIIRRRLGGRIG